MSTHVKESIHYKTSEPWIKYHMLKDFCTLHDSNASPATTACVYIVYIQQRNAHMERTVGEYVKYLTGYEVRDHVESPSCLLLLSMLKHTTCSYNRALCSERGRRGMCVGPHVCTTAAIGLHAI